MKVRKIESVEIKEDADPVETARYLNYIKYWTRRLLSNYNHVDEKKPAAAEEDNIVKAPDPEAENAEKSDQSDDNIDRESDLLSEDNKDNEEQDEADEADEAGMGTGGYLDIDDHLNQSNQGSKADRGADLENDLEDDMKENIEPERDDDEEPEIKFEDEEDQNINSDESEEARKIEANRKKLLNKEIPKDLIDLDHSFYLNSANGCRMALNGLRENILKIGRYDKNSRQLATNIANAIDKVKKCTLKAGVPADVEYNYAAIKQFDAILEDAFFDDNTNDLENYWNNVKNAFSDDEKRADCLKLLDNAVTIPEILIFMNVVKSGDNSAEFSKIYSDAAKLYKNYKNQNFKNGTEFLDRLEELITKTNRYVHPKSDPVVNDSLEFKAVKALDARLKKLREKIKEDSVGWTYNYRSHNLHYLYNVFAEKDKVRNDVAAFKDTEDAPDLLFDYIDQLKKAKPDDEPDDEQDEYKKDEGDPAYNIPNILELLEAAKSPDSNSSAYKNLIDGVKALKDAYSAYDQDVTKWPAVRDCVRKLSGEIGKYREHVKATGGVDDIYRQNKEKVVNMLDDILEVRFGFFLHTNLDDNYDACMKKVFSIENHRVQPVNIISSFSAFRKMDNSQPLIEKYLDRLHDFHGKDRSGVDSVPTALALLEAVKSPRYNSSNYNDLVFSVNVLNKDYNAGKDLAVIRKDVKKIIDRINEYKGHVRSTKGINDDHRANKMKAVSMLDKLIRTNFVFALKDEDFIDEAKSSPDVKVIRETKVDKVNKVDKREAERQARIDKLRKAMEDRAKASRDRDAQIDKGVGPETEIERRKIMREMMKEIKQKDRRADQEEFINKHKKYYEKKNKKRDENLYEKLKNFKFDDLQP